MRPDIVNVTNIITQIGVLSFRTQVKFMPYVVFIFFKYFVVT